MKIFYSWQSDTKQNKKFIEKCLNIAISKLKISETIIVDRDIQGKVGSVNILTTLLKKIKESQLFIADLTIINSDYQGKKNSKS